MKGREQVGQTCFFLIFSASAMSLAVWMGGGAMVEGWVGGGGGGGADGVPDCEGAGVEFEDEEDVVIVMRGGGGWS